jgi:putative ABC transport system ATP-binding protein
MIADAEWIRTENLGRHYRRGSAEIRAVDGVDLTIAKGEFLAVVGASGSGKSTLLNLLAGLDTPTTGHIEMGGRRLDRMSRRELAAYRARSVGMIFQSFNLLAHRSALKNVEMALYFDGTPRRDRRARAEAILVELGLADRTDHRPADLSGGEQQRVAILFADEPTGNLDQDNAASIIELLSKLNMDDLTVVMVTHDLEMARRTAGRIAKMHYGKIVAEGGDR